METKVIELTPSIAKGFLANNSNNRRVRKEQVAKYANDISNGNWLLNGETIKIAENGEVLDGQHRMLAVIKAGKSIVTLLAYGLPNNVFTTIDTGKPRSSSDVFYIDGINNSTNVSSAVSKYLGLLRGARSVSSVAKSNFKISNIDILEEYNKNPDHWQNLHRKGVLIYSKCFKVITPSDFSALSSLFQTKHSESVIDSFWNNFEDRVGVCALLFDKLLRDSLSKRKISGVDKTALIIKAFNFHVNSRTPKILKFSSDESYPTI